MGNLTFEDAIPYAFLCPGKEAESCWRNKDLATGCRTYLQFNRNKCSVSGWRSCYISTEENSRLPAGGPVYGSKETNIRSPAGDPVCSLREGDSQPLAALPTYVSRERQRERLFSPPWIPLHVTLFQFIILYPPTICHLQPEEMRVELNRANKKNCSQTYLDPSQPLSICYYESSSRTNLSEVEMTNELQLMLIF